MKKIKKYYPGTNGLTYSNTKSVGVLAPQQEDPNAFSTGKFLFPQQKTLGNIVDNKVMSQDYLSTKGPSFMDKAGDFMGNYGNIIGSVGTGIASLINANKKQDPTGKPYKNGTNMIKYQGGTQGAKAKRNMQHIMEQNMAQNAMNFILNANVANDKRNAELNSRVAPKKLESKKANVKTDSLKTNKPNLIKYQEGNEFLQSGKGMKNFLNTMEENNTRLSNASVKKEPVEKFDMSSIADIMPDIPQRFPKGSKAPDDTQVGPSRKEMADLLRAYNKKENAAGRLGYIDMEEADKMYEQNEAMMGNKINRVSGKIETLSPKMASLKFSKEPSMTPKLNMVPVKEQSKAERKAENKRLEGMAKAPISYTDNAFVGPQNFVGPSNMAGPSDQELQLGRIREDAESARKTYEARLAGESARNVYEGKQKGTPMTDALIKRSMSSQAFKETMSPYKSFKDMTPAQQKQYRAGMASGKEFEVEGIGKYGAASKEKQAQSAKMAGKSGGAKPLIKMKGNTSSPLIDENGRVTKNVRQDNYSYFTNGRVVDRNTGKMGKYEYNPKSNKMGLNWDNTLPGYKPSKPIYEFDTTVKDTESKTQKDVKKPKPTSAQIDSAINSIDLPRFKGKNTLHPLEYRSK